MFVMEARS